jgi:hypothetical protein
MTVAPESAREREAARTKERDKTVGGNGAYTRCVTCGQVKTCDVWPSHARRESQGRNTGLLLDRNDSGLMRVTVIVTRFPAGFLNVSSTCTNPRAHVPTHA